MEDVRSIGELTPWQELGPTPRLPCFTPPTPRSPPAEVVRLCAELGLRFPPANAVDRDAHTARVGLLARDLADCDPRHVAAAAEDWARTKPFFPKACELIEIVEVLAKRERRSREVRVLPAPVEPEPEAEPLTDDELRRTPPWIVRMGLQHGWIDVEQIARVGIRTDEQAAA